MAIVSKANAEWKGSLKEGGGEVAFGAFKGDFARLTVCSRAGASL